MAHHGKHVVNLIIIITKAFVPVYSHRLVRTDQDAYKVTSSYIGLA